MSKILSFVKLDFYSIKPYITLKNFIIFTAIAIFVSSSNEAFYTSVVAVFTSLSIIYGSYPFAVGDKNNMDSLYVTLGLSKKNVVTGRYLFTIIINLVFSLVAIILVYVMSIFYKSNFSLTDEILPSIAGFLFTVSFLEFIQLPFYFKLGYTKAKSVVYLSLVFLGVVFVLLLKAAKNLTQMEVLKNGIFANKILLIAGVILIWAVTLFVSVSLSNKFYKKREF